MTDGTTILAVNAGSSSIRLTTYRKGIGGTWQAVAATRAEPPPEPENMLQDFLGNQALTEISLTVHRVVHGGEKLTQPCLLDPDIESEIERLSSLAPLHNPAALRWIHACRTVLAPSARHVAVFDTAYFARMPEVARHYALPKRITENLGARRYGFHGLAHESLWRRGSELTAGSANVRRVITLQLGAGCSITAIRDGYVMDTSMGFSPLEGLVMATRCGDVDPGLVTYLQEREGYSPQEINRLLNETSGLLGVSGRSGDMRQLLAAGDADARRAVDLYCYRARKYIGAYVAVLGGLDAILFGGGVGENAPEIRARILADLDWAGVRLDPAANAAAVGEEKRISHPDSRVQVWVIPVDEARTLAQEALSVIARLGGAA